VLAAAAVCPHPPLLIPELAAGAAAETEELRQACLTAVGRVVDAIADHVVVVGNGPIPGTADPAATGSLAGYGVPVTVALGRRAGDAVATLPLSVTVGAWLARRAGYTGQLAARVVTDNATPDECAVLGARIAAFPGRTALLVMGDGSARRSEASPGPVDPRAVGFDDEVAAALAKGDPAGLAALDPALATELMVAGRAPWQVLAGAAAGAAWRAELLYAGAPYGVGYFVACWEPA
jgi:hypothetical protein